MASGATGLLRARWLIASYRVEVAFLRLRLSLRAYHADQPRVPAGNPNGGQWTDGDAGNGHGSDDDARIVHVSDDADRRYTVVLSEEEARGGHTLREHVGKTDAEMMGRVLASRRTFPVVDYGMRRDGSFESVESANDYVNRTLEQNAAEVDDVASGKKSRAFLTSRFGYRTGREAYTAGQIEPYLRTTYGVGMYIVHDPGSSRVYRIHTAYPRNDGD
ncbi:RNase A-like domain-containing protein [Methylobacterium sp. WL8]|uniref:RNase A-like domain-containing protein n=1 Tax=Methylobacterium sp. WL8 TaxID=2603899 RepID=UPI0016508D0E|nr:RNase A-like domain-containing protein [Methylobacterium sp. WL8]